MEKAEIISLVKKVKENEEGAFSELYNEMSGWIYHYAYSILRDDNDTSDVVQDVFVQIYSNIHMLKDDRAFVAWSKKIVFYKCSAILRERYKQRVNLVTSFDEDLLREERSDFLPEERLFKKESHVELSKLIAGLSDETQHIISLFYYWDVSTKEIAELLNISDGAVRVKLLRARARLKEKIKSISLQDNYKKDMALFPPALWSLIYQTDSGGSWSLAGKEQIWNAVQKALDNGTTVGATTSTAGFMKLTVTKITNSLLSTKLIAVVLVATVGTGISAGFIMNGTESPTSISENLNPSNQLAVRQAVNPPIIVEGLERFVGKEDAAEIRLLTNPSTNQYKQFIQIAERNQITRNNYFIDESRIMYVLYTLDLEGKRLLIITKYHADKDIWVLRYQIEDASNAVPEPDQLVTRFKEATNK